MLSYAPTNMRKHFTSNIACSCSQRYTMMAFSLTYLGIPDGRFVLGINGLDNGLELDIRANFQLIHWVQFKHPALVRRVGGVDRLKVPHLMCTRKACDYVMLLFILM